MRPRLVLETHRKIAAMIESRTVAAAACVAIALMNGAAHGADRDYQENADFKRTVSIVFDGTTTTVTDGAGVTVAYGASTSQVAITSAVEGVQYVLSGTSGAGHVQITSTQPCKVRLAGVTLTSTNGPAVSMISAGRNFVVSDAGTSNSLTDSASYTRTGSGTLYASGPMILSGEGAVTITGIKSHAIYGGSYIRVLGGAVKVPAAVKDAVHSKTLFQLDDGALDLTATGDGIDGDTGNIVINGGSLSVRSLVDDTKAVGCDGTIAVNGGLLNLTVNGVQSKGLSCGGDLTVGGGSVVMNLAGAVFLESVTSGATTYVDPAYCTGLKSKANIAVSGGSLTLTHTGIAGKGISADGNISITGGVLDLATTGGRSASFTDSTGATDTASADCLKADGTLTISAGTITASSSGAGGDCLSSDLGLTVSGGNLSLVTSGASGDCLASDQSLSISGGVLSVTGKGAQSKGLKSGTDMAILGGTFTFAMSGAVVLEPVTASTYNPSYCTAMKCDGNLTVSNGTIGITHSGQAGKGISVDGNITITGGTLNIATSGANTTSFSNASGTLDMAAADCMKADGSLTITGGTITAASTGNAADAISCDGAAIIGVLGNNTTPVITASTTGAKVLLSGSGMSADYVNAKAFKAGGNLTMNGGIYRGTTQQDGGEGMESKANLTIAGGLVEISSYDDGINATTSVNISGGQVYCYSSGNDGIDSNGTFNISGGLIVTSGSNAPEEGFDCDANQFKITGGILIGSGGATSTPTAAVSTQRTILYKGTGTLNTIVQLKTSTGTNIVTYKIPRTYSGGGGGGGSTPMTLLLSSSAIAANTSYVITTGATVSGGTEFHGYYTGATVTGSTTVKSFTIANGAAAGLVTTP